MTDLKLREMSTGTEYVENPKPSMYRYKQDTLSVIIGLEHINCENDEEILDAISRKAEQYFDRVNKYGRMVYMDTAVTVWSPFSPGVKKIGKAQSKAEKGLKNTMEDVFGVGCVEVTTDNEM